MSVARKQPGGAAYNDIRNLARRQNRSFQELLSVYALEGFLARLACSNYRDQMVLKGGVLLAAFDLRRPTRDVDLQAQNLSNDATTVRSFVCEVAALPFTDGLVFDTSEARAEIIRDVDEYSGIRVNLVARLALSEAHFHVDVNVGDPISPEPQEVVLPRVLGEPVRLRGYPMALVHAEKIVTAVSRGTANTRWRDFGDIYSLCGLHPIDGDELLRSLASVASHRKVALMPLHSTLADFPEIVGNRYTVWRRKHNRMDLPEEFEDVMTRVSDFADPALIGSVAGKTWDPINLVWK